MRKIRRVLWWVMEVIMFTVIVFCIVFHSLVVYGLSQARGQLDIVWSARPAQEVLDDPAFPDSLKKKLLLVQEIKKFAVDSLGIKESENYNTVYDQHGQPVLWTVTACEPFQLKAKKWRFPLLGSVSYKGFFYRPAAIAEAERLKKDGYDTDIAITSGWSTLGFFKDPILSNMLYRSEGELSNLIIHELTHGTLYVKSGVDFNENLASFVGDKGAQKFLQHRFGKNSKEYRDYLQGKKDEDRFNKYILRGAARLDSLYQVIQKHPEVSDKEKMKKDLVIQIVNGVDKLPIKNRKRYKRYAQRAFSAKNAFFMMFIRYDSAQGLFEKEFKEKFHSDIKLYLAYLKEKYPSV
jgi:predicted aminopeptidase